MKAHRIKQCFLLLYAVIMIDSSSWNPVKLYKTCLQLEFTSSLTIWLYNRFATLRFLRGMANSSRSPPIECTRSALLSLTPWAARDLSRNFTLHASVTWNISGRPPAASPPAFLNPTLQTTLKTNSWAARRQYHAVLRYRRADSASFKSRRSVDFLGSSPKTNQLKIAGFSFSLFHFSC